MAALACLMLLRAVEVEEDEGVLVVKNENYQQVITENEFVLIEFCKFAPLVRNVFLVGV